MQETLSTSHTIGLAQQRFITKVFGWMATALLTTAFVSYYIASTPEILNTIVKNSGWLMFLIFAQLGLVIGLSAGINRISATSATVMFFVYSALTGITLSTIFMIYTAESLTTTFLITSVTFGGMAVYGFVTKKDLTSLGSLAFMGLFGIIIASVVNLFLSNSLVYTITTYIGIMVFVALTAYDAQAIKRMGPAFQSGTETEKKGAILGALRLYLDFINLFLMLLRLFGRRR